MRRPHHLARPLVIGALAGLGLGSTLLFLLLLVHTGGSAFLVFYLAGRALSQGVSPYHIVHGVALNQAFEYLPWVAVAFEPISRIPFPLAYYLWISVSFLLALLSTWLVARALGWRRCGLLVAGVGLSSVLWRCLYTGQMDAFALALETLGLLLAIRQRPTAAGALSVVPALLKPQVLWLFPVLLFVQSVRGRQGRRFAMGGVAATLLLAGGPAIVYPELLLGWLKTIGTFASSISSIQPDLAGLPGLLRFAPSAWRLGPSLRSPVTLAIVTVGLICVAWLVWRTGRSLGWARMSEADRVLWAVMLPLGVWFLASPYSHSNDILVLIPLLVVALGTDGREVGTLAGVVTIFSLATLPELFLYLNPAELIGPLSAASVAVLVLVLFAWRRSPWRSSPAFETDPFSPPVPGPSAITFDK